MSARFISSFGPVAAARVLLRQLSLTRRRAMASAELVGAGKLSMATTTRLLKSSANRINRCCSRAESYGGASFAFPVTVRKMLQPQLSARLTIKTAVSTGAHTTDGFLRGAD